MKPRTFIIVHGINRWTAFPRWDSVLGHRIENNPSTDKAHVFDWKGGPIRSVLFKGYNAGLLAMHFDMMANRRLIGVAHSYGSVILQAALARIETAQFRKVYLFAPACDWDLEKAGYFALLRERKIGTLHIYGSKDDRTLKSVHDRKWRQWTGYGYLGYKPPVIPDEFIDRVSLHYQANRDHSWWPMNMDALYHEVIA